MDDATGGLDGDATVVAIAEAITSTVGGETVLLNLDDGTYYGLNDVGAHLWDHLDEPTTVAALETETATAFGVDPETCRADVQAFLTELHDRGLIEVQS